MLVRRAGEGRRIVPGSGVELVRSEIGMVVRAGTPKLDTIHSSKVPVILGGNPSLWPNSNQPQWFNPNAFMVPKPSRPLLSKVRQPVSPCRPLAPTGMWVAGY